MNKRTGEFATVEELVSKHREIFRKGCSVTTIGKFLKKETGKKLPLDVAPHADRPIPDNQAGVLAETTVRIPFDGFRPASYYLQKAILQLQTIYDKKVTFDLVITGNLILKTQTSGKLDVWFGQDFSNATDTSELRVGPVYRVRDISDVSKVPTEFSFDTFAEAVRNKFPRSSLTLHSVINLVYIIRTFVPRPPPRTAVVKFNAFWEEDETARQHDGV
jgi:hypothetical protein